MRQSSLNIQRHMTLRQIAITVSSSYDNLGLQLSMHLLEVQFMLK